MGCQNSRGKITYADPESIINKSTSYLNFDTKTSKYLDRMAHRFSTGLQMSKRQFKAYLKVLNLQKELPSTTDFFKYFYNRDTESYSVKQLSTLGILLGKSKTHSKAHLLFQNYDEDCTASLSKEEISEMIEDIFYISCDCLPGFTSRNNDYEIREFIDKYRNKLKCMKKSVCNHYTRLVFYTEENESISILEFKNVIRSIKELLDPAEFRIATQKIYDSVSKAADMVDLYMKPDNGVKPVIKEFVLGDRTARNRIS